MSTLTVLFIAFTALTAGLLGGYLLFRMRYQGQLRELQQNQARLNHRRDELNRLTLQFNAPPLPPQPGEAPAAVQQLREQLEQRSIELKILRQDYELDTSVLRQDLERTKTQLEEQRSAVQEAYAELNRERERLLEQSQQSPPPQGDGNANPGSAQDTHARRPAYVPLLSLIDPPEASHDSEKGADTIHDNAPPAAPAQPQGGDRLSLIWGIDATLQDRLYRLGYTTFEQLANLTSTEAQRLGQYLGIERQSILDHWIPQAQLLLYERHRS